MKSPEAAHRNRHWPHGMAFTQLYS